ncbi:MAG TPA: triose-phosphate isomerase, partial [Bacteroidales bacterium]|nr:triose-phosphate isomerase [Bacteroidales bacterium]
MRKKIVAGNWKMNMNLYEGLELARGLNDHFTTNPVGDREVILCTPFIH